MKEIWKDIKGYEGYYQVSNFGQVRSVDREIVNEGNRGKSKTSHYKGRILSAGERNKGYLMVVLTKNSKMKSFAVHRLVAQAFIPNPNNYPQVNHIDENKTNNRVDNLEWCTCKYNVNYGSWKEKQSKAHKGLYSKKVVQIDKQGNYITTFNSITEAERITGIRHISTVACGKRKYAGGFIWKFLNEYKIPDDNGALDIEKIEAEKYGKTTFTGHIE